MMIIVNQVLQNFALLKECKWIKKLLFFKIQLVLLKERCIYFILMKNLEILSSKAK